MEKRITFNWSEKKISDAERVGAMYCFKRCDGKPKLILVYRNFDAPEKSGAFFIYISFDRL